MRHAPGALSMRDVCENPVQLAVGPIQARIRLTYPPNLPYAGAARPHPVKKSQSWVRSGVKEGEVLMGPKDPKGLLVV